MALPFAALRLCEKSFFPLTCARRKYRGPGRTCSQSFGADSADLAFGPQKNILGTMHWGSNPSSLSRTMSKGQFPVCIVACIGLIVLGASPIIFSWHPAPTADFFHEFPGWQMLGRVFLAAVIAGAILMIGRLDPEPRAAKVIRYCGFVLLAALLTDMHLYSRDIKNMDWQMAQYQGILLHHYQPPDQYRFLPQGTLWWMLLCNGDFFFSYLTYRFFFTFLVCQSSYMFARLYLAPRDAVIVVLFYAAFFPLSTRFYYGNLLDPMSHTVMLAALACCQRRQFWQVFWLFALGMFIKETMLLIVPCYYLMNPETFSLRDSRALLRLALFAATGLGLFLACRIPFDFSYDLGTLNRTPGLMVYSNLGLAGAKAQSGVPIFQRHLHPILFIFMWLPLIVWRRKLLPPGLFRTSLYLAAAFYLTNLCFGWNYESRNFVPVLIFLLVCNVVIINRLIAATPPGAGAAEP
jgi:hypothetical protein